MAEERLSAVFSAEELKVLAEANGLDRKVNRGFMEEGLMVLNDNASLFFTDIAQYWENQHTGRPSNRKAEALKASAENAAMAKEKAIEFRKKKFAEDVRKIWDSPETQRFIDYWSEYSGYKMRWEKEKVFQIRMRIERWIGNNKNKVKDARIKTGTAKVFN